VIGKDAKDISIESAADFIAGYTCGNDISSRKHQRDPKFAGSIPQWGFSKGFDGYAPIGPCIVSTSLIPEPEKLRLRTLIDGEVRQDTPVSDLLFKCAYLISYLSSGTTLQKGSIVMTGTPGGVGASFVPPRYLQPGTVMEVEISEIGVLRNRVEFTGV
jgi:2-keto-4-pentenoate hydratase/2-oxohepta-3-ene-1,7-dioic acid hydratase in catechol pathway